MIDVRSASTSEQVSAICGVTLRELQWWDEQAIVSPRIESHKRLYTPAQVEQVRRIKELRILVAQAEAHAAMRQRTRADAQEITAREKMSQGAEVDDVYPDMPR